MNSHRDIQAWQPTCHPERAYLYFCFVRISSFHYTYKNLAWIPNQVGDDSECDFKDDNGCDFEDDRSLVILYSMQIPSLSFCTWCGIKEVFLLLILARVRIWIPYNRFRWWQRRSFPQPISVIPSDFSCHSERLRESRIKRFWIPNQVGDDKLLDPR